MIMEICSSLCRDRGAEVTGYMYDGCIVRCDIDDVRETVLAEIRSISTEIGIEAVAKPWWSARFDETSLPIPLRFSGYASFAPDTGNASRQYRVIGACLFDDVRNAVGGYATR